MSLLDDCPAPTTATEFVYVTGTYTFDFSVYPNPPYLYEVSYSNDCCSICTPTQCCPTLTAWPTSLTGTLTNKTGLAVQFPDTITFTSSGPFTGPTPPFYTSNTWSAVCADFPSPTNGGLTFHCFTDPHTGIPQFWQISGISTGQYVNPSARPVSGTCVPFVFIFEVTIADPGNPFLNYCHPGTYTLCVAENPADCPSSPGPPPTPPPPPPDYYCGPYGCVSDGVAGCLACISVAGGSSAPGGYHSGPWDTNEECLGACDINPPAWCCSIRYFDAAGHEVLRPLRPGGVTPPSLGCGQGNGKIGDSLAVDDLNNGGDVEPLPPGIATVTVTIIDGPFESLGVCVPNCGGCGGTEEIVQGPCNCEPGAWCLQWQDYDASDTPVGTPYGGGCINDLTTPPTYTLGEVDPTHFDPANGAASNVSYRKRTFLAGPFITLAECRKACYPATGAGMSGFTDPCVRADWYCATPIVGGTQSEPVFGTPVCIPVPVGAVGPPGTVAGPFATKSLCESNPCPPPSGMEFAARSGRAFPAGAVQGSTSSQTMSVSAQRRFVAARSPAKPAVSLALLDMGEGLPCRLRSATPTGDMEFCAGCLGKRREIPLFECSKFEFCTPHTQAADESVKCCRTCKFREYDPEPVRVAVEHGAGGIGDSLQLLGVVSKFRRDNPGTLVDLFVGPVGSPFVALFEGWDSLSLSAAIHCEDTGTANRQANLGYHWNETHGRPMARWDLYAANIGSAGHELPALRDPEAVRAAGADLAGAVVLAPLSTDPERNWPIEKWLEIEARLLHIGYTVVILHGGPTAAEEVAAFQGVKVLNEFPERVAGVILNCTMFAGNDSGLAHLAGALGVPTTVVGSGPLDKVFGCYPSVKYATAGVMADVTVDAVFDEVTRSILGGGKLATLRRLILETDSLEGDVAELGVYRGGAARLLSLAAPGSTFHLFDTFAGIPEDDAAEGGAHVRGEFACDLDAVRAFVRNPRAVYHPGTFPDTAADAMRVRFRFVHIDGDTYQTTRAAIAYFVPRMVPGGLIVFDDCDWPRCPGVRRAIDEAGLYVAKPTHHQGVYRRPVLSG